MSSSTTSHRLARMAFGSVAAMLVLAPVDTAGSIPTGDPPADPPTLAATVSPTVIAPDGQLTYSSVDPCPEAVQALRVSIGYGPDGWSETEGGVQHFHGTAEIEDDGSWSTTVPGPEGVVPGPETEGRYELVAQCVSGGEEGAPPVVHARYGPVDFDVVADTPTPSPSSPSSTTSTTSTSTTGHDGAGTTARPRAQPARPVAGEPEYTG